MNLSKFERKLLDFFETHADKSYSSKQVAGILNYRGHKNYKRLIKALAFFERKGLLKVNDRGQFSLHQRLTKVEGTYRANAKGFGFLAYDPEETDLFIPPGRQANAMDGDLVEVEIIRHVDPALGRGSEAQVIRILERQHQQIIGEFTPYAQADVQARGYIGYVKPKGNFSLQDRVEILADGLRAVEGAIVVVSVKDYPTPAQPHLITGVIVKEVGHKDAPGVDILSVLYQFGIPHEFSEEVLQAADALPQEVQAEDLKGRVDLRDQVVMTIDGADAKDIDDAIALNRLDNGKFQLFVHIADVTHYVQAGGAIDLEARDRGTSVYLTDRVVPMLPQKLSNGICSLHPGVDRLTLTCEMMINSKGWVEEHQIYPSVIHSENRLTYDTVNQILAGDETLRQEAGEVTAILDQMEILHHHLEAMRRRRGALGFETPEAEFEVDEEGYPLAIHVRERGIGERMIESFMLVANETVARHFNRMDLPFIYRIHEQPDEAKMQRLAEFVTNFGIILRGQAHSIEPKQVQAILDKAKDQTYEHVISMMTLRSMQQAKYDTQASGHYGLAAVDYTHFTAPIRRYPDLTVHRLIHQYAKKRPSKGAQEQLEENLQEIADHSSMMERRSIDAERQVDAMKKAEFMADKIGEEFDGVISSITSFGIFVELANTVEGLITLRSMTDDYYDFNPQNMLLTGQQSGKVYQIGQEVKIRVAQVDVEECQIDFELLAAAKVDNVAGNQAAPKQPKPKGRKKRQGTKRAQGQKKGPVKGADFSPKKKGKRKKGRRGQHDVSFKMRQRQGGR